MNAARHAAAQPIAQTIASRLEDERGTLGIGQSAEICLAYPSPYRVGMSSLGFQTLYRRLNEVGFGCHRAFLPDAWEPLSLPWPQIRQPIISYEAQRPISSYRIIGLSVAYELEIGGVIRLLEGSGIPLLARDRGERDPIIIGGGPLTNSNPSALLPFVDVLICGEAELELQVAVERILGTRGREQAIANVVDASPHAATGEVAPGVRCTLPKAASAPRELLPAYSAIVTPHTELADMFLVEPERGCSRQCTFCVMRGPTAGGMRLLPPDEPLALVPEHARRVGLVGAAVTDHPKLEQLVDSIVRTGRGIGISSLRADRLTPDLIRNLARGGYRQITVASDGISERMRRQLIRRISEADLLRAARLVREDPSVRGLKVYEMIGVPGETDDDVQELVAFANELTKIVPLTLTFSTFVAKRNTPLDGQPFVGVKEANRRLRTIRDGLRGRAEIRPQSPRWAHVEYLLAQRGVEAGYAAIEAVHAGGRYRDWIAAFDRLAPNTRSHVFGDEEVLARRKERAAKRSHLGLPVISSTSSDDDVQ
jgi:radical SAM superfamily enzyme YgiQ (UPF0313 family)